jgi:hypothetical protein
VAVSILVPSFSLVWFWLSFAFQMVYHVNFPLILEVNTWIRGQLTSAVEDNHVAFIDIKLKALLLFYDQICLEPTPQNFKTLRVGDIDFLSCLKFIFEPL